MSEALQRVHKFIIDGINLSQWPTSEDGRFLCSDVREVSEPKPLMQIFRERVPFGDAETKAIDTIYANLAAAMLWGSGQKTGNSLNSLTMIDGMKNQAHRNGGMMPVKWHIEHLPGRWMERYQTNENVTAPNPVEILCQCCLVVDEWKEL